MNSAEAVCLSVFGIEGLVAGGGVSERLGLVMWVVRGRLQGEQVPVGVNLRGDVCRQGIQQFCTSNRWMLPLPVQQNNLR